MNSNFKYLLLVCLLTVSEASAKDGYLQILDNEHVREVIVEYNFQQDLDSSGVSKETAARKVRKIWFLNGDKLSVLISQPGSEVNKVSGKPQSNPNKYEYLYNDVSFTNTFKNGTRLKNQMILIESGSWIPPLPENDRTSRELVCPLLGCYVAGNLYMQRYEGSYAIEAIGVETFKGVPCMRYAYSIKGPFSTYFKNKGVVVEDEKAALIKLQQDVIISGFLLIDLDLGIIYARSEATLFRVAEFQRVTLASEWVTTKEHANISREEAWVMESMKIVYR